MNRSMNETIDVHIPLNKKLPFWSDEFWKIMGDKLDSSDLHSSRNAILLFLGHEICKLFPKHFHTSFADDSLATTPTSKPFKISFDTVGFCADLTLAALEFDPSEIDPEVKS